MYAASPEELETLIEDAVIRADVDAIADLLCADVLMADGGWVVGRGEVARALAASDYFAAERCLMLVRDVAIVANDRRVDVCCREVTGSWRLGASITLRA